MKRLIIALALFQSFHAFAQDDSIPRHGTIKVARKRDSTYIKAYTKFYVYANNPAGDYSYKDYMFQLFQNNVIPTDKSGRIKVVLAAPDWDDTVKFDYTRYFRSNHYTRNIKMRSYEADTVRLLINVDKKGVVKFIDISKIEKTKDGPYAMRNENILYYPADLCHQPTEDAFKELILKRWTPAIISQLKTHPSQHKVPYTSSKAYTQGILTVIYSGEPLEN